MEIPTVVLFVRWRRKSQGVSVGWGGKPELTTQVAMKEVPELELPEGTGDARVKN
jgi:hypothetical protein